ncbi:MAG: putative motility protein [Clostridia bacterium]|nr:putative motility protein [Clostridia bacterium]
MDIPALSMYMAQSQTLSQVGIALLDKNLETVEGMGEDMTKMLERSVTPELGGNIDISL